jgi:integrase
MPVFMQQLRRQEGGAARALELILAGARLATSSASPAKPTSRVCAHIAVDAATWTIPKNKSDREHRVPLSRRVLEILEEMRAMRLDSTIIFPSLDRLEPPRAHCPDPATGSPGASRFTLSGRHFTRGSPSKQCSA